MHTTKASEKILAYFVDAKSKTKIPNLKDLLPKAHGSILVLFLFFFSIKILW